MVYIPLEKIGEGKKKRKQFVITTTIIIVFNSFYPYFCDFYKIYKEYYAEKIRNRLRLFLHSHTTARNDLRLPWHSSF